VVLVLEVEVQKEEAVEEVVVQEEVIDLLRYV